MADANIAHIDNAGSGRFGTHVSSRQHGTGAQQLAAIQTCVLHLRSS
jgi:hypothetical protein